LSLGKTEDDRIFGEWGGVQKVSLKWGDTKSYFVHLSLGSFENCQYGFKDINQMGE